MNKHVAGLIAIGFGVSAWVYYIYDWFVPRWDTNIDLFIMAQSALVTRLWYTVMPLSIGAILLAIGVILINLKRRH